jgi:hypothetical protein
MGSVEGALFGGLTDSPRVSDRSLSRLPGTAVRVEDSVSVLGLMLWRFLEVVDL